MTQRLTVTTENALFQVTRSLSTNRNARHRERAFLVEGVRAITRALERGWTFNAVWHAKGARLSAWANEVLVRAAPAQRIEASEHLLAALSDKEETSELLAVLRMPEDDLARIPLDEGTIAVIVDRPTSPGNLGSLIRSVDAFGASGVIVVGHAVDPYEPQAVRATQGSVFAVPVVRVDAARALEPWLDQARSRLGGFRVIGTDPAASTDLWDAELRPPLALALGNEARGMSSAVRAICDAMIRIPMSGTADSLNLASAGTVTLYEIARPS